MILTKYVLKAVPEPVKQAASKLRSAYQPYYKAKPKELVELEKWAKANPVRKDYVYKVPENYKKPSLYHPAYLGKKGNTEVDIAVDKLELNNQDGVYSYAEKGDEPKVKITDINPTHSDNVDIFNNINAYIGNKEKLPVGEIIFSQNNNSMEVMQFIKAGMRSEFQRFGSEADKERARQLRKNARKRSRIKANDKSARWVKRNGKPSLDWHWAHLIPVGYHGSEGDERLGVRWWGQDNSTVNDGNGTMQKFEDRQEKRKEGFYWLTRIEKYDDGRFAGLRWIYKIYSQTGEELDSEEINHLYKYRDEVTNVWSSENADNPWSWSFGIDYHAIADKTENEEETEVDENDPFSDYVYSTKRFYFKSKRPDLEVSFGQDANGNPVIVDLASPEACHCIYCGTTGSGKSVQVISIISQLMHKNTPQQVQFVGIDPKMTEFGVYKDNPYWAINPILNTDDAAMLARWVLMVSETRSAMFVEVGVKNLEQYNEWVANNPEEAERRQFGFLPHLFLFTDEFASLMAQNRQENEDIFNRIAAEGRAQGIHAHLATQRPSVDVITGTMKNNFPCKCGLSMGSYIDSSTLMEVDENDINPHQLKGRGDNICKTQSKRVRSQGYFFSNQDVEHINNFTKVMYYGTVKGNDHIKIDNSKVTHINYKRDLMIAGLVEEQDGKYVMVKKKAS